MPSDRGEGRCPSRSPKYFGQEEDQPQVVGRLTSAGQASRYRRRRAGMVGDHTPVPGSTTGRRLITISTSLTVLNPSSG